MFVQIKLGLFLVIAFHGCNAVAKESENCDRVQFSFDDLNGIATNQNFTKQSFEKNGKPVYYSLSGPENKNRQLIIWWNNINNTWLRGSSTEKFTEASQNSSNKITKTKSKITFKTFQMMLQQVL